MDPYNYMSKMKTVLVFRPNENTGAADRRMAGPSCAAARHTRKASERNAVSTNGLPLKKPMPSDHARREMKKLTHTHKRTKPKKLHKNLNFAKWQQSKRDTKRCMLCRTTKLTSDVETFCQPLQWPRVPLSQVPCLCADSTICVATNLRGLAR